jgi:hypothetical protein
MRIRAKEWTKEVTHARKEEKVASHKGKGSSECQEIRNINAE